MLESIKQWFAERKEHRSIRMLEHAKEVFQLKEYMGKIWLTYNGGLVCPSDMISGDIIERLNEMRCMYAARNE